MEEAQSQESKSVQRHERGASLVEYGLLLAMIALVCVAALGFLGGNLSGNYSSNTTSLFGS